MQTNHITEMVGLEGFEVVDSRFDETAEVPTATLKLEAENQEGPWVCGACAQLVETRHSM